MATAVLAFYLGLFTLLLGLGVTFLFTPYACLGISLLGISFLLFIWGLLMRIRPSIFLHLSKAIYRYNLPSGKEQASVNLTSFFPAFPIGWCWVKLVFTVDGVSIEAQHEFPDDADSNFTIPKTEIPIFWADSAKGIHGASPDDVMTSPKIPKGTNTEVLVSLMWRGKDTLNGRVGGKELVSRRYVI